nr:MAG TPA: hypothetical protein [Caudoviricetes sp.]
MLYTLLPHLPNIIYSLCVVVGALVRRQRAYLYFYLL